MARDPLELVMKALRIKLSDETGISTGSIYFDKPSKEFINEDTYHRFPSIGIIELHSMPKVNLYGDTHYVSITSGYAVEYTPAGELAVHLEIILYTESIAQRRTYKPLFNHFFEQVNSVATVNDVIDDQYFTIVLTDAWQTYDPVYTTHWRVKCCIQDFKEENVYLVKDIYVGMNVNQEQDVTTVTDYDITLHINEDGLVSND